MAAELRLGVSFDLVYFRQQLQKLGRIAASEFTAPIKIKLDRQVVDRELNDLQKAIKRRKYNIELNIAGNLSKKTFEELQGRLDTLSQRKKIEVPVSIKNAATSKEISDAIAALRSRIAQNQSVKQGGGKLRIGVSIQASISNDDIAKFKNAVKEKFAGITNKADVSIGIKNAASGKDVADTIAGIRNRIDQNQAVKQGGGKLRVGLSIKPAITNADIAGFKRTVEEKFSGLSVKIKADVQAGFASGPTGAAGLYEYMRSQGLSGGNVPGAAQAGRRAQFEARVAQANTEQLQSMLRRADVPGRSGLRTKAAMQERLRQLDDAAMEGLLGNLEMRMREPRKVQRSFLDKVARAVFWMAGVDPEYLRQQAAQRRALPNVSFPATVPPGPSIGPSSTGRALPPGAIPGALPGSAFARQRFLPPQIGQDLNNILRNAAFAFVDSLNSRIRQVNVREIGRQALPPSMIRGLLPAGVGREPSVYGGPAVSDRESFFQRRIDEARARSAARGAAIMAGEPRGGVLGAGGSGAAGPFRPFAQPPRGGAIVPYQPQPSRPSAASPIDFSFFQQSKLPLTGAIRELGDEFGTAVKQVLLFGTAYKALAFVTSLPSEALNAATALQTFRNQLEAVTGGTAQAEQAFAFVSDVVSQLNIPLESARAGFIRMYASMEPAGIAKGDIENLFVGISKAAATFGMSTDEVNRVTNAFAQMASKGQLSAEEVKNQLGDVMPGALSLFARAAQMDIGTFLKAMEDGAFKADAMGQVLRNVGKLLNTEYGGAAANAANTLQGALNGLTTAVKLMYESFEPLVSVVASTLFPQIETVVIDAAEAVKAFAAGMQGAANPTAELSSNGLAMYNALGQVVEIAKSLEGIITGELGTALARLGGLFLTVTEYIARLFNTGLGQWLTRITIEVGLLTAAWGLLSASGIIPATVALLRFVATLNIAQLRVYIAGIMSMVSAFLSLINTTNLAKVAVLGFKTVVLGAVGAGVLFAIDALVQRFMNVGSAIRDVAAEARRAKVDLDSLAAAGQLAEIQGKKQLVEPQLQSIEKAQSILQRMQQARGQGQALQISQQEFETLQRTGLASGVDYRGGVARAGRGQIEANLEAARRGRVSLLNQLGDLDEAEQEASRQAIMASERNQRLEKITLAPGKEKKDKKQSMSDLIGGDIERWLDESLAALEQNIQTQLTNVVRGTDLTGKIKYGENTEDAERMIKYAGQYQEVSLKVLAIDETIKKVREQASALVANGIDPAEKLAALESKRRNLAWEAATIFQKHSADAIVAAKKRDEELEKEKQKRMQIVELIEEAEVAAGLLSPLEAARRKQQRGFETNLAEAKKNGTPEQVARLEALQAATPVVGSLGEAYQKAKNELDLLLDGTTVITSAAQGFGDAFSKAFTDIITGAQSWKEGLGNAFKSVASMFADMVAQMLAKWAFMQIVGMFLPGGKAPGGQQPGLTAGINQYPLIANANGGVLAGGFQAFASGGVVTGPTLGLVGEGRFNEAVVPLPNGKSIPVDLGQGAGNNISTNIVVNMNNGQSNSQMSGRGGQALGRELEGAVRNVILKETRPGGLIYSAR